METLTAVKERGILFKGEMVRAILSGQKTQTRRTIQYTGYPKDEPPVGIQSATKVGEATWKFTDQTNGDGNYAYAKCPYGAVGDRLWVRETWKITQLESMIPGELEFPNILYKATMSTRLVIDKWVWDYNTPNDNKWRPSLFMPRKASRILLEITDVRVERLQDITEEDSKAEGVEICDNHDGTKGGWGAPITYRGSYSLLWDKINGPDSWQSNPYVWVITFKQVQP